MSHRVSLWKVQEAEARVSGLTGLLEWAEKLVAYVAHKRVDAAETATRLRLIYEEQEGVKHENIRNLDFERTNRNEADFVDDRADYFGGGEGPARSYSGVWGALARFAERRALPGDSKS